MNKNRICLNMIVKDESPVIRRCLDSVKKIIDYWVIVDTGSSDDTKEIIKDALKDVPGELLNDPWVNFEYNRNRALDWARNKADYVLFMDADEVLSFSKPIDKSLLTKSFYVIRSVNQNSEHLRIQMIDSHPGWEWKACFTSQ